MVVENAPLGVESATRAGMRVTGILLNSPLQEKDLLDRGAHMVHRSVTTLWVQLESVFFGHDN
jgi:beta-phosphoglucomutase-like phosphatase (HAD superfamily)